MVSLRRMWDDVAEAGVKASRDADARLPGVTRKVDDHLEDVKTKVNGIDRFDDKPDLPTKPDRPASGRNDGRDERGRFIGDGNTPWVDREKTGLDNVADREGVTVIRDQVAARTPATGDQIRYYDGLFKNPNGTYTGIEVKSGSAGRNPAQRLFDGNVSVDTPAVANLPNAGPISIVKVILERVP